MATDNSVESTAGSLRSDRIYRETKWLSAIIVPFLVAAFYILYLRPTDTKELFAWEIKPSMTAMMLGAVYIGGAYFFVRVIMAQRWHWVKLGFIPVVTFASFLGIDTILHWDRFNHSHVSFIAWAILYFTTPFLVFVVWLRNRGTDSNAPDADDVVLARPVRLVMACVGIVTFLISIFLFLQPDIMINLWPWKLTPLTARVVGSMFALGVAGISIALEYRWSAVRIMLQAEAFMLFMILTAAIRAWSDFDLTKPGAFIFVGGLILVLVLIGIFYFSMEAHRGGIKASFRKLAKRRK